MSSIEDIFVNGMLTPQIVVPIIGDGACLFRSISFYLFNTQERCQEIRNKIVSYVSDNWNNFITMSYNSNGDNFSTAEAYVREMVNPTVYGGYCELVAAGNIFPFLFQIYYNHNLYAKFGVDTFPKLSGLAYNPTIDYKNNIGSMNQKCNFCNALKWKGEIPGMCCNIGKTQLDPLQPPPEPLRSLLEGDHPDHDHFINRTRKYNSCFQMTSFGAKQIVEEGFMPTFKVQGQVYHLYGSLIPNTQENPQFLQIYFVGEDEKEVQLRCSLYPEVKQALVKQLQNMLHTENKYIRELKTTIDNASQNNTNFQVVIHADRKSANGHKGCYNAATCNEVALVIVGQQFEKRDIIIQSHDNRLQRISELHRSYDALQYPLMFCYGEDGYSIDISQKDATTKLITDKTVSAANFYSYKIMVRKEQDNHLLRYGPLFNQYLVDMYAKIETERLNFIRNHQNKLRADKYIHLKDTVGRQDVDADQLGKLVVLPSSFTGGPRYMHERSQDALTYVRHYGSSDLFVTFTCNPKWQEIQEALLRGQKHYHRPDIIARVFNRKVKELIDLFKKGDLFGKVRYHIYSVEWQKRGLPHVHILLWLENQITSDMIDKFVCAEIPNPDVDPLLYEIVKANMIHGPCGLLNKNSPCMKGGVCSKRYPVTLIQETQRGEDGYPKYRRRSTNDGGFKK
ncbi:uncharacterized protein LOC132935889 [Metopolophium dirhodum]|uniref:uncharacterized protein LOC132935889 n=1 Tax=Metopolophium dirhodum TaxID=44670 RepID=UPI00298FA710|nr:uncharacterized protein LOC132935889 [Metopolophium dirhodum]